MLKNWIDKTVDNFAAIVVMLGLNVMVDVGLYMFGFITWDILWDFLITGSFMVFLMTLVGIAMFARIKGKSLLAVLKE